MLHQVDACRSPSNRRLGKQSKDLAVTADYIPNRVNVAVETQDDGSEQVTEVVNVG